jgi:holo-[acyl-carrier protein] synthase
VQRIRKSIERHGERFIRKIFTEAEIAYCDKRVRKYEHYAARFAAKEAALKALGTGAAHEAHFLEIEVVNDDRGKPEILLHGQTLETARTQGVCRTHLSLAHTDDLATAQAIMEANS